MTIQIATLSQLSHGPQPCKACFEPCKPTRWGELTLERGEWRIENNPGYWGAPNPQILVLGFSKGANQRTDLPFDRIGFNRARANLHEILVSLGLLGADDEIDRCFTAAEMTLGFASVVRCGLGKRESPTGAYLTSGKVIREAIEPFSPVRSIFDRCTELHLGNLPKSVRLVVFLGLDQPYIDAMFQRICQLQPSTRYINDVAYGTDDILFIHAIHPSPLATSHRQNWVADGTPISAKRHGVLQALELYGFSCTEEATQPIERSPYTSSGVPTTNSLRSSSNHQSSRLAELLIRGALTSRRLRAEEIVNQRSRGGQVKKMFRLRRYDGEEFALQLEGGGLKLWSSVKPPQDARLRNVVAYPAARTRHANLSCMPRLRGPDRTSKRGADCWQLEFDTPQSVLDFLLTV